MVVRLCRENTPTRDDGTDEGAGGIISARSHLRSTFAPETAMDAAAIFARLSPAERNALARYYRYTLVKDGPPHQPRQVAEAFLQLSPQERTALTRHVRQQYRRAAA